MIGVPSPALEQATVLANGAVAPSVMELVLRVPRVAAAIAPGQFVHLRVTPSTDVLLRRPLSVHRAEEDRIRILYQIVGRGTDMLSRIAAGAELDLIGPLGNGWRIEQGARRALVVAGGLGAAPMGMLVDELHRRAVVTTVALGALTESSLLAVELFADTCERVEIATDDGSAGTCGFVTAVLGSLIAQEHPDVLYTCGPEPMQRAVARIALAAGVPCQMSLERRMACGVGACLSCVVPTVDGLKRACVDGPVFDAGDVLWADDTAAEAVEP